MTSCYALGSLLRMFKPIFTLTPAITKALMEVEACRQIITSLPLTVAILDSLRRTARLLSTHFSTQIEGNKLSPSQVVEVLEGGGRFPGRERDEAEVRNYYKALEFVLGHAPKKESLTEQAICTIHGLVISGKKTPTHYREGQNVIRDGRTGSMVYLPPEAKDVPALMKDLITWIKEELQCNVLPVPVIAGLAHYQYATIHPYYDGNGRTARLLTTCILHHGGYGLHGIYSLEEYYAEHLQGYYDALHVGTSHNYYEGRAEGDVTPFIKYFCVGMADSFAKIRSRAEQEHAKDTSDQTSALRELKSQQQKVLSLFARMKTVASSDVAKFFKISARAASALCLQWIDSEFLVIVDPSKKARRYALAEKYEVFVVAQTMDKRTA